MTIYELKCLEFDHRIGNRNIVCNISAKIFNSNESIYYVDCSSFAIFCL